MKQFTPAKLYQFAEKELKKKTKEDNGNNDEALREHWYWEGYTSALSDAVSEKEYPSLPTVGHQGKDEK